jgi:hypothetical protein
VDPNVVVGGGTAGLIALLVYIVKILWDAHKAHDADVIAQRDAAHARVDRLSDVLEPILRKAEKAP